MLAVVELPVMHERNLLPTTLLPTTAQRCSSLATQSGSISSILSELESTTLSNSAVFKIEKCKAVDELIKSKELRSRIDIKKDVTPTLVLPTRTYIIQELHKPGRDPRQQIQVFEFDKNVKTIEDLTEGMELPGIVNNITNFGCFVDIGIKEKGLVHVSQLADKFVSDPPTVVSIHQHVRVKVMSIDLERKRIQLTMKGLNQ